jgi:hypothetical protein
MKTAGVSTAEEALEVMEFLRWIFRSRVPTVWELLKNLPISTTEFSAVSLATFCAMS